MFRPYVIRRFVRVPFMRIQNSGYRTYLGTYGYANMVQKSDLTLFYNGYGTGCQNYAGALSVSMVTVGKDHTYSYLWYDQPSK